MSADRRNTPGGVNRPFDYNRKSYLLTFVFRFQIFKNDRPRRTFFSDPTKKNIYIGNMDNWNMRKLFLFDVYAAYRSVK